MSIVTIHRNGREVCPPCTINAGSCTKGLRIVSDAFPINRANHAQYGRYACSERGLVLLTGKKLLSKPTILVCCSLFPTVRLKNAIKKPVHS
ncbi:MAG: hypothetical protein LBO67_07565 [Spirochaetaceae bacterium]|nr:hypothetical protein [Spirochaetaceae bacterium]